LNAYYPNFDALSRARRFVLVLVLVVVLVLESGALSDGVSSTAL
jgi:hypothetical protein